MSINSLVKGIVSPWYFALLFTGFGMAQISRQYLEGLRIKVNGQITKQAFLDIATRVYSSLLNLDLKHSVQGTRTHVFSTNKAKKSVEKNFSLIVTSIIPTLTEFGITSGLLLWMYGPSYFAIFVVSIYSYVEFTKRVANKRKEFIEKQNESDKIGDLMINETMQNFLLVKSSSGEDYEKSRYYSLINKYMTNFSDSQTVLAKLNLGRFTLIQARRLSRLLRCQCRCS